MNKKRLLVLTLALSIIGTTSVTTYAVSQNTAEATKNVVLAVDSKDNSNNIISGNITDDEAVKIATKALKDYFGVDAKSLGDAKINRTNYKDDVKFFKDLYPKEDAEVLVQNGNKHTANVINIYFASASELKEAAPASNIVAINEENGEIVTLACYKNLDSNLKPEVNDNKIKDSISNFVSKLGKNIQSDSIKVRKNTNKGGVEVIGKLQDGRSVIMEINLKDYSVDRYEVDYDNLTPLPSMVKDHEENFRELQVK